MAFWRHICLENLYKKCHNGARLQIHNGGRITARAAPEEAGHMVPYIIEVVLDLKNKALPASLC